MQKKKKKKKKKKKYIVVFQVLVLKTCLSFYFRYGRSALIFYFSLIVYMYTGF